MFVKDKSRWGNSVRWIDKEKLQPSIDRAIAAKTAIENAAAKEKANEK